MYEISSPLWKKEPQLACHSELMPSYLFYASPKDHTIKEGGELALAAMSSLTSCYTLQLQVSFPTRPCITLYDLCSKKAKRSPFFFSHNLFDFPCLGC